MQVYERGDEEDYMEDEHILPYAPWVLYRFPDRAYINLISGSFHKWKSFYLQLQKILIRLVPQNCNSSPPQLCGAAGDLLAERLHPVLVLSRVSGGHGGHPGGQICGPRPAEVPPGTVHEATGSGYVCWDCLSYSYGDVWCVIVNSLEFLTWYIIVAKTRLLIHFYKPMQNIYYNK